MWRMKQLETRMQEVLFLLAWSGALSLFFGAVFFLGLDPFSLLSLTGSSGRKALDWLFRYLGFATFYGSFSLIFLGQFVLSRASQWEDLFRLWSGLLFQIALQIGSLLLLASTLTVFQSYFLYRSPVLLAHGSGGWLGQVIGGNLFIQFGLYGSLVLLSVGSLLVAILSGALQLATAWQLLVDGLRAILHKTIEASAWIFDHILYTFGYDPKTLDRWLNRRYGNTEDEPTDNVVRLRSLSMEPVFKAEEAKAPQSTPSENKSNKTTSNHKKASPKSEPQVEGTAALEVQPEAVDPHELIDFEGRYTRPDVQLLKKGIKPHFLSDKDAKKTADELEERLKSFQIFGKITAIHQGVRLTLFEFQPDAGVKVSKITSLSDDLALLLGASSIRIMAPIPGKTSVGIEVPNTDPSPLLFSDLVRGVQNEAKSRALPIALGKDVTGKVIIEDIATMPHLLVAGTTGSGKSVFMNTLIQSLLFTRSPKELRLLMIDPKMIELTPYNGIPHLLQPVITDLDQAKDLLVWAEKEMDLRYQRFADLGARNITSFNEKITTSSQAATERRVAKKLNWEWKEMPYIVILVDELADLMITQGKDVEIPITRIAQKARAAGIHLVLATQRPSSDIVTGLIKTNFPTRISFKVSSAIDSRTILDSSGAEKLLGNGDLLFIPNGKSMQRIQASFVSEDEVKRVVKAISNGK